MIKLRADEFNVALIPRSSLRPGNLCGFATEMQ